MSSLFLFLLFKSFLFIFSSRQLSREEAKTQQHFNIISSLSNPGPHPAGQTEKSHTVTIIMISLPCSECNAIHRTHIQPEETDGNLITYEFVIKTNKQTCKTTLSIPM